MKRIIILALGIGLAIRATEVRCPASVAEQSATAEHADLAKIFQRGQMALQQGDLEAAETDFRKVLQSDPRSAAAYVNLGVIEMRRKNWDRALAELRHAEKLAPKMPGIRLNIGLAEYKRGNYPDAIEPLSAAMRDQPDAVQTRYSLGVR